MRHSSFRSQRGAVLILSLWMVMVLTLLAFSLAMEIQVETRLTSTYRDQFKAEMLARHGIARAVSDLRNDRLIEKGEEQEEDSTAPAEEFDALGDVWAGGTSEPRLFEVDREMQSGKKIEGEYELLVIDEESKLFINSSNPKWTEAFKYLLMIVDKDLEEDQAMEIANAVKDWTDFDDLPTGENESEETERMYYAKMREDFRERGDRVSRKDRKHAFLPKNAWFETVDELLQIPGITPEMFYGYDPEETPDPPFFPRRVFDKRGDPPALRDLVTVRTSKINLNTVSYPVFAAVAAAALGSQDMGEEMSETLIKYRQGGRDNKIDNDDALRNISEVSLIDGFNSSAVNRIRALVPLTLTSNAFTIYCRANVGEKQRKVFSSSSKKERPLPTKRIIAEAVRQTLSYPIMMDEEGNEGIFSENLRDDAGMYDEELMPAYRAPLRGRSAAVTPSIVSGRTSSSSNRSGSSSSSRGGSGSSNRTGTMSEFSVPTEAWYVPVVYFKRWNSY